MGLGAIFDSAVREFGRSDAGTLLRASDKGIDGLFRGSEARDRKRHWEQYMKQREYSSSSNNSGGGFGTLLVGAALFGALALLGNSGDKTTNAK